MIFLILDNLKTLMYSLGYLGIFLLMSLESSFIPFPSEVVLIPAGYLASIGKLNILTIIIYSIVGSLFGATINYYIGKFLGRNYILKHKKFFFINEKHLIKSEHFFKRYGGVTTFVGRLIPVIRQYISLPAGFSDMNYGKFALWTVIGSGVWDVFLVFLGYFLGTSVSKSILSIYDWIILAFVVLAIVFIIIYYYRKKKK